MDRTKVFLNAVRRTLYAAPSLRSASPASTKGGNTHAGSFDGVDDYVSSSDAGLPTGNAVRTAAFWIKTAYNGAGDRYAVYYGEGGANTTFGIGVWQSGSIVFTQWGQALSSGAAKVNDNNWHHVAVTHDATTQRIYIDGTERASGTLTVNTTSGGVTGLNIGGAVSATGSTAYCLNALIDDVRIYNHALTAAEVATLAQRDGPIAHWKLDNDAVDAAGTNNGTVTGATFSTAPALLMRRVS